MSNKLSNLYFAYGSNTNLEQMAVRCPMAKLVGTAKLKGYKLAYRSGLLTLIDDKRFSTTCATWKITPRHERTLDKYEGCPTLYDREYVQGKVGIFKKVNGLVYIMQPPYTDSFDLPSKHYHRACMQGYKDCGIDTEQLEMALHEVVKINSERRGRYEVR